MRFRAFGLSLAIVFLSAGAAPAQSEYYLPQVGNGAYLGISMRTTFVLFNPTDQVIMATLQLTNDSGGPLSVTIPGLGTGDQFGPFILQPGQSILPQTDGSGALAVGAARVVATGALGVSAIFTLYDSAQRFLTEAGVGASPALDQFVIPVDSTESFNTGVALFNFAAGGGATVTYTLVDASGAQATVAGNPRTDTIPSGGHVARFFAGPDGLFSGVTNFRGTLVITSSQPIAGTTLRQNGAPLSNTTLPVVSRGASQTNFSLPQVANGFDAFSGFSMRTTFVVFNISTTAATLDFKIRKSDATPFPVTIPGAATNSANFSINLAPGAAAFLQTDGLGDLSVGSAEVSSNVPVGVAAIFTLYGPGTKFLTEAGVGDAPPKATFTLPVDFTADFNTGFALFNSNASPATVNVRLFDADGGKVVDAAPFILGAKSQRAQFFSELFPGRTNFRGSMAISATGGVSALTLRQNGAPLSYTTLPVADGVSQGNAGVAALLDASRLDVNATANATVNVQLQAGFKLSGAITGAAQLVLQVMAVSNTGASFVAGFNPMSSHYEVVVPAGAYTMRVCYAPQTLNPQSVPSLSYEDAIPVQVNGDTIHNITIPASTLRLVSGTVAGISQLPTNTGTTVSLTTADGSAGGFAPVAGNGAYAIELPNGTYTASLVVSDLSVPPNPLQTSLSMYNVGNVVVNNAPVTANLSVPNRAVLSGVARRAGLEHISPNAFVTATDTAAPAQITPTCNAGATLSQTPVDPSPNFDVQRAYQMQLATGRSYRVAVVFPLGTGGNASFPANGLLVGPLTQNTTQFLDVPALPATVIISGQVTDPQGQPVAGVSVSALSSQLTGAPAVEFSGSAITDAAGNYSVEAPAGTAYQLFFAAPRPTP